MRDNCADKFARGRLGMDHGSGNRSAASRAAFHAAGPALATLFAKIVFGCLAPGGCRFDDARPWLVSAIVFVVCWLGLTMLITVIERHRRRASTHG